MLKLILQKLIVFLTVGAAEAVLKAVGRLLWPNPELNVARR